MIWTAWSPAEDHLAMLAGIITLTNPAVVVEYGGGLTTRLLRPLASGRWITIDHDPQYVAEATEAGAEAVLVPADQYARWPIGKVTADLILIDGIERPACLAAAHEFLAAGGHIALHDAERPEYQDALSGWDLIIFNTEGYAATRADGSQVAHETRALAIAREARDAVRQQA